MQSGKRLPLYFIMTALMWYSLYTYVPFLTAYADIDLKAGFVLAGLIAGSYGFTQMVIRIPLGIVSDLLKKRKIFISAGMAVSAASGLGMYFFQNPFALLVFRSLSGVSAAVWVIVAVLFASYFKPGESVKAIGYVNAANTFGTVTGLLTGGLLANAFGTRSTFLLGAGAGFAAFLLSFWIIENREIKKEPLRIKDMAAVSKNKLLLCASAFALLSQYIVFTTAYGFTPVLVRGLTGGNFNMSMVSVCAALPGLALGPLTGTVLHKKLGPAKTVMIGFFIAGASCIAMPYCTEVYALFIAQFFGGAGTVTVYTMLAGLSVRGVEESKRATAMGFFQAVYGLGMFIGPFFAGIVSENFGLNAAFVVTGCVGLAAFAAAGITMPKIVKKNISEA
ncbi:MAG: MFS transporter [Defluviitaleaceae bacterium]|nr:MFS transporter [Defluviitaleaceae bacterium]